MGEQVPGKVTFAPGGPPRLKLTGTFKTLDQAFMMSPGEPIIQGFSTTGKAVTHIRHLKVENWTGTKNRAIVNLGGGPRPTPKTDKGVLIYLHDYFGPGRDAKIVSTKTMELKSDGFKPRTTITLTWAKSVTPQKISSRSGFMDSDLLALLRFRAYPNKGTGLLLLCGFRSPVPLFG